MSEFTTNFHTNCSEHVQPGVTKKADELFLQAYKNFKEYSFQVSFTITRDKQASEDISHDIFVKLWQQKESIIGIKDLAAFITILSRNKSIDYVRKQKHDRVMMNCCAQSKSICFDLNDVLGKKETERLLQLAIHSLSPHRRRVFVLGWLEGWTREEIAERLQVSPHTVKNLMQQARQDIQIFFTKHTGMRRSNELKTMRHVWHQEKVAKVA